MAESRKKGSQAKKGIAATTALAAAAGLAAAAFIYLKRRGIDPKQSAKQLGRRARTAGDILKGESREAYDEVRQVVVDELITSEQPMTKAVVQRVVNDVLKVLKQRGELTKAELTTLGEQLKGDWQSIQKDAEELS